MNRTELVRAIAEKTGQPLTGTEATVKALMDVIIEAVGKGEKVSLVGFGNFSTITRKARSGRNPANNKPIKIPAKTVPKFAAGKAFIDAVDK